ncbi:hypothetical protein DEU56DRAFT_196607 [Suillus clintonianus]|uniref:uncharacterized protein n=1 Tax=Suillus clintonianus TaxID=1904413 RepID=UPI001B86106E|nr:uncharacterized protein DEU56DRAFT_196607 [Suillus clintonianus]KAG2145200.1 hypothetical protein DEU56DRAFT_196607 [Suillus clintonianus]
MARAPWRRLPVVQAQHIRAIIHTLHFDFPASYQLVLTGRNTSIALPSFYLRCITAIPRDAILSLTSSGKIRPSTVESGWRVCNLISESVLNLGLVVSGDLKDNGYGIIGMPYGYLNVISSSQHQAEDKRQCVYPRGSAVYNEMRISPRTVSRHGRSMDGRGGVFHTNMFAFIEQHVQFQSSFSAMNMHVHVILGYFRHWYLYSLTSMERLSSFFCEETVLVLSPR